MRADRKPHVHWHPLFAPSARKKAETYQAIGVLIGETLFPDGNCGEQPAFDYSANTSRNWTTSPLRKQCRPPPHQICLVEDCEHTDPDTFVARTRHGPRAKRWVNAVLSRGAVPYSKRRSVDLKARADAVEIADSEHTAIESAR